MSARLLLCIPARYSHLTNSMERALSNNTIKLGARSREPATDETWAILGSGNIFSQFVTAWRSGESLGKCELIKATVASKC